MYQISDATVSFSRSAYSVNEGSGQIELALILGAPASFDVTANISVILIVQLVSQPLLVLTITLQ